MKKHLLSLLSLVLAFATTTYAQDGMSVGTNATPVEMLDVNGAIKIGTTTNINTGGGSRNGTGGSGGSGVVVRCPIPS